MSAGAKTTSAHAMLRRLAPVTPTRRALPAPRAAPTGSGRLEPVDQLAQVPQVEVQLRPLPGWATSSWVSS